MSLSSESVTDAWLHGRTEEQWSMRDNGFGSRTEPVSDYGDYEDPQFGDIQVNGEITLDPEAFILPSQVEIGRVAVDLVN